MKNRRFDRRTFLKGAIAGSAAAASVTLPQTGQTQQKPAAPAASPPASPGYAYLNLEEQAFIETLVDHMVPADELSLDRIISTFAVTGGHRCLLGHGTCGETPDCAVHAQWAPFAA